MADRFEDLRTFIAVVDATGFKTAADQLGVVKSAVSRRVRDLENRIGVRLINRSTRRISLTETGEAFYQRGLRILADLEEAETNAASGAQNAVGRLRISAPVTFTVHCLAPLLPKFLALHPRLEIEVETNDRQVDLVGEGFDLALRISQLKDSNLAARQIMPIRHVACASPSYLARHGRPSTPAELRHHFGAAYLYVDAKRYWTFANGESVEANTRLWLSNGDALREAAVAGCGIVVLPTFIAFQAIEQSDLEIVLQDFMRPPIGLHAVFPSNRHVPAKVRIFVDFLLEHLGEVPFWDRILIPNGEDRSPLVHRR